MESPHAFIHRLDNRGPAMLLALVSLPVQAISFSFPFPGSEGPSGQRPPPGWQFRPQAPTNAQGVPPGYPFQMPWGGRSGYPPGPAGGYYQPPGPGRYQQPSWGRSPSTNPYGHTRTREARVQAPRLEVEVENRQPYVQENLLLILRVVSQQNLATATPEFPSSNAFLLQKLEGPEAHIRTGDRGQQEIVNQFVYILTPLRSGTLELPEFSVVGETAGEGYGYRYGGGSTRYEAKYRDRIRLQVRPALASVQPWLPLRDLRLKAVLDHEGPVEEGQPVSLMLELRAVGATGAQLPSLEPYLKSPDFRVYREQTLTEGKLSSDGAEIEGRRTEYYTLVPRSGGRLYLPAIRIPWWNVERDQREYATLPVRFVRAQGETGPFGLSTASAESRGGFSGFWLPLAGLGLLVLGYWLGVWYRSWRGARSDSESGSELGSELGSEPAARARLREGMQAVRARVRAGLVRVTRRLNPALALDRFAQRIARNRPPEKRFLACVRRANRASDPVAWARHFQDPSCRHLHLGVQGAMPGMTDRILALRPGADRAQIERLIRQLDGALYGGQDIDFPRWKRQFHRQVGRGRDLFRRKARKQRFQRPMLPELNPRIG